MSTLPFGSPPWLLPSAPFGGFDPFVDLNAYGFAIPQGDPTAVAGAAGRLTDLGAALADQARNVQGGAQAATSDWQGSAASTFATYAGHLVSAYSRDSAACGEAARALDSFSGHLAHAQTVTRRAQADCQHAEGQVTDHQTAAHTAGQAAQAASTLALLAPHPADAARHQQDAQRAQQAQSDAQRAADAAQTDLEAAQKRGRQAYDAYVTDAQAASTKLVAATQELRSAPVLASAKPAPKKDDGGGGFLAGVTGVLLAIDAAQGGLDPITDGITVLTGGGALIETATEGAAVTEEVAATAEAEELSGTALARQLGKEGEDLVPGAGSKVRIPAASGKAAYRIPDILSPETKTLGEVKNVGKLSYSSQLHDFEEYAAKNGYEFDLYVRPTTQLSGPLQDAVREGKIALQYLAP